MSKIFLGIIIGVVSSFIAQGIYQNNGNGDKLTEKAKSLLTRSTSFIKRDAK